MDTRSTDRPGLNFEDDPLAFLATERVEPIYWKVRGRIFDALKTGNLIIVGCADLPKKCIAAIRSVGGSVPFVIEFEPRFWGQEVLGIPILSPDEGAVRAPKNSIFIVAVWSPQHCYENTREWLSSFGVTNIFPVAALFWTIPEALGPHYQLSPPLGLCTNRDKIDVVLNSLSDIDSRQQFLSHLRWRVSLDPNFIPDPDRYHMYFDPRLIRMRKHAVIADVGAFDGDTLRVFLYWQGIGFSAYHAFEPDPLSYQRLEAYLKTLPLSVSNRVIAKHLAVAANAGVRLFDAVGKPGSRARTANGCPVECCRLDHYFGSHRLDYIKIDIEGEEQEAVSGVWSLIVRDRPILAIAVYHWPHDIFEIPLSIIERTKDYRYILRSYDHDGIDLVFYAIPNERAIIGPYQPSLV